MDREQITDTLHRPERPKTTPSTAVTIETKASPHGRSGEDHRRGQTLHIVEGIALLGSRDGTVIEAHAGDTPQTYRAEQVTDDTCRAPRTPTR
ncbi:hypothetical protein [Streptomyces sp. NPDC047061]|uniref:hypothetical protein n=1 Tax=Streptomyces sp. NPDC047061 TaxID=3154605 RepID=UPI0033C65411